MKKDFSEEPIGEVNTPLDWALWAAERYGLLDRWIEGSTVLDPTMGEGNLLEAFLCAGLQRGIPIDKLPLHTLFGIERRGEKIQRFFQRVKDRYRLELPRRNFIEADILTINWDEAGAGRAKKALKKDSLIQTNGDREWAGAYRATGAFDGSGCIGAASRQIDATCSGALNHAQLTESSPAIESLPSQNPDLIPPADILFGNPPWITFASLPDAYKNQIRELFLQYSLVKSRNQALLGRSRVDLSALVVLVSISRFLRTGGEAVFFLPLSLFFGEGAGEGFRQFRSRGTPFHVRELVELPVEKVFHGVSTRGGLVYLKRDEEQKFPVPVYRIDALSYSIKTQSKGEEPLTEGEGLRGQEGVRTGGENEGAGRWEASPIEGTDSSWILYQGEHPFPEGISRIPVPPESFPRQGINTCGANDLFFFDSVEKREDGVWAVSNSTLSCLLPSAFLFPLLTTESFHEKEPVPHRWVFLPYQKDGRPLSPREVEEDPYLKQFMGQHRDRLKGRKGVLIQQWIQKGYVWALFGVGAYCFFPWKIVWEAAGRKEFKPRLWVGVWQANQSLFGYLPLKDLQEARRVLKALQDPRIEAYLLALQAQGTLNWAQPGRMRRLFASIPAQGTLSNCRRE